MSPPKKPTHRIIAQVAGVSIGTVSLALRNDPGISLKTREHVQKVAADLGYRQNPSVSMLMSHIRSRKSADFNCSIAYLHTVPLDHDMRNSANFQRYYNGARRRAEEMGFSMELFEYHAPGMTPRRLEEILLARGIRGIILEYHPISEIGQDSIEFSWDKFATVSVGAFHHKPRFDHACSDYFGAISRAYKEVHKLGYKRIGLAMSYYLDASVQFTRSGGFHAQRQFYKHENEIPVVLFKENDLSDFIEWFESYQPEVLIGLDYKLHRYIRESGRRIPGDVGWVYCGWYNLWPNLTGVDMNEEQVGEAGVDLLSSLLHMNAFGPPERPKTISVESFWHRGKTTLDLVNGKNEGILADQPFA